MPIKDCKTTIFYLDCTAFSKILFTNHFWMLFIMTNFAFTYIIVHWLICLCLWNEAMKDF